MALIRVPIGAEGPVIDFTGSRVVSAEPRSTPYRLIPPTPYFGPVPRLDLDSSLPDSPSPVHGVGLDLRKETASDRLR